MIRRFIRHPTDIAFRYKIEDHDDHKNEFLKNIGHGGLCFRSREFIEVNTELEIHIPIRKPEYVERVLVIWCNPILNGFWDVGVTFLDEHSEYRIRMIEQICHIEHYRKEVLHNEGRHLSTMEAASEWVEKYAEEFDRTKTVSHK